MLSLSSLLAAFAFLSPGADAGLSPVFAGDVRAALTNDAPTAKAIVFSTLPKHNLLASFRKLGVKTLEDVRFDGESSAEFFRRRCGFAAFHGGADGVWTPYPAKLPVAWQASLAAAKDDVAVAEALCALAEKACAASSPEIREAGRHAKHVFVQLNASGGELDALRATCVAECRALEKVLQVGEPLSLPEKPAALPEGTIPFVPFEGQETASVKLSGGSVALAPWIVFQYDFETFAFVFSDPKPVCGRYRFRLYVPSARPGEWVPHAFELDMTKPSVARAELLGSGLNRTRERFADTTVRRAEAFDRYREKPVRSPRGESRPLTTHLYSTREGPRLPFTWSCLSDRLPLAATGEPHVWYLEVETEAPARHGRWKLLWPRGSAALAAKYAVNRKKVAAKEPSASDRLDEINLDAED